MRAVSRLAPSAPRRGIPGTLDLTPHGEHVGGEDLQRTVERVRPRLHVFGHFHHGYGVQDVGPTPFVNDASVSDEVYAPVNSPGVVDLQLQ
jgi:Icc-related predicted phosphoesterase